MAVKGALIPSGLLVDAQTDRQTEKPTSWFTTI